MVIKKGKPIISAEEAERMSEEERKKFDIVEAEKPEDIIPRGEISPDIKQREEVVKKEPEIKKKPARPGIYVDARTGRPSGITLPDGRTFFGLSPEEIRDIQIVEGKKTASGQPLDLPLISELPPSEKEIELLKRGFEGTQLAGGRPTQETQLAPRGYLQGLAEGMPGTVLSAFVKRFLKGKEIENAEEYQAFTGRSAEEYDRIMARRTMEREIDFRITAADLMRGWAGQLPFVGSEAAAFLGGDPEARVQSLAGQLEPKKQMATSTLQAYRDGLLSREQALKSLRDLVSQINDVERQAQAEAIISIEVVANGDIAELQTDILEARQDLWDSINGVLTE